MRTGFGVKTPKPSASSSFLEETLVPCGFPAASVHQPSIRAQTTAHDVSIRSSTIDGADRRGGASHSMSRSSQTIDHLENARTGTSALGSGPRSGRALHDGHREWMGSGRPAAAPEFFVVNLIAQHDVETHEELAGQGDFGLGPAPSMEDAEVAAPQLVVRPGGERRGLAQHPPEQGVALLGDLAESLFVGGRVDRGGQADVAHDVLTIGEACEGPSVG